MASTTKIMTSILALEEAEVNQNKKNMEITYDMINVEGSSMGLEVGDIVSLEDLVYGMLLPSGNDAANAAAMLVSGSKENFIKLMNSRAKQIGMKNTHFTTPSGLDYGDHHSTARDMAILGAYCMENEKFASITSKLTKVIRLENNKKLFLKNHNKLLDLYKYCIGIKTGFTKKAGRCLVSCALKDNIKLVAVTLNASDDWNDHIELYNYGFKNTISKTFDDREFETTLKVINGESSEANIISATWFSRTFKSDILDSDIQREIVIPEHIEAPVHQGQIVGKIVYKHDGIIIGENILTCKSEIPTKKIYNIFIKIINFFKKLFKINKN
ncbi:MAG: D-alanyl-D-alanine carboxypeptidase [Candidatus Improbicoccus devescovinae]|nr:MAG: D-alanyl-D-alanine carboxypeptidase [Candidatus Improbicoccus devescovinae]